MAPIPATFTFADGRTVNRIGFGAMRLTGQPGNFGPYEDWEKGKIVLREAARLGVNHFDSARAYGPHHSERLIADALGPFGADIFVATKGGNEKNGPGLKYVKRDGRPEALKAHIDQSLADLGVDRIDLYYLHAPDPNVPFEESIGALAAAKAEGKIARIGLSNVTVDQLRTARGLAQIDAVQNSYIPAEGGDEAVLNFTTEHGIAFVPWGPLGASPMKHGAPLAAGEITVGRATPVQAALRALLQRAPNILPIPGTTSLDHLAENMQALTVEAA